MNLIWWISVLCCITICQVLVISFYLFIKKKGNTLSKILISCLLFIWSVFIAGALILITPGHSLLLYDAGHILNLVIFLAGPVLFIHFNALFDYDFKFSGKTLIHAFPFFIVIAYITYQTFIQKIIGIVFYPRAIYLISALFVQNIIYF
jgi:hypothetical protein